MTRDEQKKENSRALIIHFAERREHAATGAGWASSFLELIGRDALLHQAWRAEWEGLFTVIGVPHLAAIHDVQMLLDRVETMRCKMLVDPNFVDLDPALTELAHKH